MEFREGTFVSKGDLLYTIDPQPFEAKLVEAQSNLAAAHTRHAKAEADLARIRPLAEMKAVSEQDLDGAVAQEAAARASVQASEAAVELANIDLSYTRIVAPIDGLIGLSQAKPGEFVGRDPNPVVLNTLSDIDPVRVRFSISEREYLILARHYLASEKKEAQRSGADQPKDLILLLADGSVHDHMGQVVAASQSIDQETGTYSVEASFANPQLYLLPGQFARVRAEYQVLEDAVVIPRQAVSEMQGLFRAYVIDAGDTVAVREIELGPETGSDVVIESGLVEGDEVIVEGLQRVRPGMKVRTAPYEASKPGPG
jgi:membrane fusion protein (multidrug efflux system)